MKTIKMKGLARQIQYDYLESGRFAVGSKLPTVSELAQRYDVSAPTIRKAAGELANQGWLTKKRGSGIFVEVLPEASQAMIGYISTDFRSPLQSHVLEGVNCVANRKNCHLAVASTGGNTEEERRQVQSMIKRGAKGIVLYCSTDCGRDSREDYLAKEFRDYPIVVVDSYSPEMSRPHVVMDNCYAGYEMTQYLLAQNRRHIVFFKFDKKFCRSVEDRFAGYKKALEKANLPLIPEHVVSYDFPAVASDLQSMLKSLVSTKPRTDAIIMLTDGLVPVTINFLRRSGISVPQDIIVAGFDNLHGNLIVDIWPTTKPNFVQMGELATEILLERIASGDLTSSGMVLPCPLLLPEAESVACDNRQSMADSLKA